MEREGAWPTDQPTDRGRPRQPRTDHFAELPESDADAIVQLVTASSDEPPDISEVEPSDPDDIERLDRGLTLGNLPSALGGVESVAPDATFEKAITLMLLNDYSQLAVLGGKDSLRGAVTWKSIAQVRHSKQSARLADAIIPAGDFRYDKELIDVLPTLEVADFVFVRDQKNAVAGIVTTAAVVHAYGELATPFFLIGELDQLLRQVISGRFELEEIKSMCVRPPKSFDDLAFGDYQGVLGNDASWAKLSWPLDHKSFINRLDELRQLRNDIMHFNTRDLPAEAVGKLRNFIKLLHSTVFDHA